MGEQRAHEPVLFLLGAFSRRAPVLDWAQARAASHFGPIALASERFHFTETSYYEPTMGEGLLKCFWAFERPYDPQDLADAKHQTNAWEAELANRVRQGELFPSENIAESRPLNLDPGYLTPAKLVLASTKDFAHRIYLRDGIFAEITLHFRRGAWLPHEFTFPDYRRPDYQAFFTRCRDWLLSRRPRPPDRPPAP